MKNKLNELVQLTNDKYSIQCKIALIEEDLLNDTEIPLDIHTSTESNWGKWTHYINVYAADTAICLREYATDKDPDLFIQKLKAENLFKNRIVNIYI